MLAFSNALDRAVRKNMHNTQIHMGLRVPWGHGQSLDQGRLGSGEARGPVSVRKVSAAIKVNYGRADQCFDVTGIERQARSKKPRACVMYSGVISLVHTSHALEIQVHRIRMQRTFRPPRLGLNQLSIQRVGKSRHDFVLHIEQIGDRLVEAVGPKVIAGFSVDQLHTHPEPIAATLHRAFEHIANVQFPADLL